MQKFEWCLEKGENEKKHKGVRKIAPNSGEADGHIGKALHNLRVMESLHGQGFDDWCVSAAFYSMYHAALAVLYELGFESRNQECTFTVLEHLIEKKTIDMKKETVWIVRKAGETLGENDAKSLRETFQYGVETKVNPVIIGELMKNAREVVQKMRIIVEEIRSKR